jgi:hypothetical protein
VSSSNLDIRATPGVHKEFLVASDGLLLKLGRGVNTTHLLYNFCLEVELL